MFSVTFMSGQTSGRKYFQDVGVCACLLGVCLIWSASVDNMSWDVQILSFRRPSRYLLVVLPLCVPCLEGLCFRQQKEQQQFHSWKKLYRQNYGDIMSFSTTEIKHLVACLLGTYSHPLLLLKIIFDKECCISVIV